MGFIAIGGSLLIMLKEVALVKRAAFVAVVLIAIIWKAPPGYWTQMQTVTEPTKDYNWTAVDGRKQVALRGIAYMLEYPVFGIGVSNFPMAEGTISSKAKRHIPGTGLKWSAAHNSHIEAGSEMGIPGALLWITLHVGGIVGMIRLRRRLPARWARGAWEEQFIYYTAVYLPIALIGFSVTASFVSFAYNDPIYLLAAYMSGLYVVARARTGAPASLPSQPRQVRRRVAGHEGLASHPYNRSRPA